MADVPTVFKWSPVTKAWGPYTDAAPGTCVKCGGSGGFIILGEKDDVGDLPSPGQPGDAWIVDGHLWIWDVDQSTWIDTGVFGAGAVYPNPNLIVGAVTTLAPGSSATVEITGSWPDYVINFGVPRGADGADFLPASDTPGAIIMASPVDPVWQGPTWQDLRNG